MQLAFRVPADHELPRTSPGPAGAALGRSLHLWTTLRELRVTGESVAWLSLLSKCLNGLRLCQPDSSPLPTVGLAAAERLMLELHTHVHVIARPLVDGLRAGTKTDAAVRQTRQFLRLYAAWCLKNEREVIAELRDPRTLEDLYEPHTARALVRTLGEGRDQFEAVFGAIPEDSDQQLALDRRTADESLARRQARLDELVATLRLGPLLARLKATETDARSRNILKGPLSFPAVSALMTRRRPEAARFQLKAAGLGFMYATYMGDSLTLHGSGLGLEIGQSVVVPAIVRTEPPTADDVARALDNMTVRLSVLRRALP